MLMAACTAPSTSIETEPVNEDGVPGQSTLALNRLSEPEKLKGRSCDIVLLNAIAFCSAAGESHVNGPGKDLWSMRMLTLKYFAEEAATVDVAPRAMRPASGKPATLMYHRRECAVSPIQSLDGKIHAPVSITSSQHQLPHTKMRFPELTAMVKPPRNSYRASKSGPQHRLREWLWRGSWGC
jgi:hypothetical protein